MPSVRRHFFVLGSTQAPSLHSNPSITFSLSPPPHRHFNRPVNDIPLLSFPFRGFLWLLGAIIESVQPKFVVEIQPVELKGSNPCFCNYSCYLRTLSGGSKLSRPTGYASSKLKNKLEQNLRIKRHKPTL